MYIFKRAYVYGLARGPQILRAGPVKGRNQLNTSRLVRQTGVDTCPDLRNSSWTHASIRKCKVKLSASIKVASTSMHVSVSFERTPW